MDKHTKKSSGHSIENIINYALSKFDLKHGFENNVKEKRVVPIIVAEWTIRSFTNILTTQSIF